MNMNIDRKKFEAFGQRFILARVRQTGGNGETREVLKLEPTNSRTGSARPLHNKQVLEQEETMKKANNEGHTMKRSVGIMIAIGMAMGIGSAVAQTGNGAL